MSRRTSVLLEDEQWDLLARKAKRGGRTVSEEIRAAVEKHVEGDRVGTAADWLEFARYMASAAEPTDEERIPIDSEEAQEAMARAMYRDATNRDNW